MKLLKHNGYDIEVKSRKTPSGLWRSDAQIKYGSDSISIGVLPYGRKGYDSEAQAEEKTVADAKAWIDKKGKI